MTAFISASTLKSWLHDGAEIALFDLREAGEYGGGHLFYAVSLPYSRMEIDLPRLAPRRSVRMVFHGESDETLAIRAAARASALGYDDIHILAGGAVAWAAAGHPLFKGVNVVSKAFGELAEHAYGTPALSAPELAARLARGDNIVVLDGRPFDEYRKMSIPGAICCPNGELGYRVGAMITDPATTIVVNCAGRTRSIIGAQTLRHLGLPNPIYALRNGTMGWRLAGYDLDHGKTSRYPAIADAKAHLALSGQADALAKKWSIARIGMAEAIRWRADPTRSTYLLDVRTAEEFEADHVPGAVHAPGGQLVQATDHWLGVRRGRVILIDDARIRATTTAIWLQAMGWEVAVLSCDSAQWPCLDAVRSPFDSSSALPRVTADHLGDATILDLRSSQDYRAGHIAHARWAIRSRIEAALPNLPESRSIALVADQPEIAQLFAQDLPVSLRARCSLLTGGIADWRAAGQEIVATPDQPTDAECIDYLFFVHDRHAGNLAAARQYLAWETGLVAQLDELEKAAFRLARE
ncbi:rhodanese-like domain-containing protein [Dongia sp.]|uniref:rhodanese-like domain-containing protein n=1 Tax=Dongia sp. TaxID=1977262 RepID=UPI0035AE5835